MTADAPAPPGSAPAPAAPPLAPFAYHARIVEHLRDGERDLWSWFSSNRFRAEHADAVRLDLLKSTYRLDRAPHADLYAALDFAAERLGVAAPRTLYQSQVPLGMNAALIYTPGEAHVVLTGPVEGALSPPELRAVFAHELAHFVLLESAGGDLLVADQILSALAGHERAEPSHVASARLFRLYTELYADRGSLAAVGDPLAAIGALVKVGTGLATADAASYLRQAEEILGRDEVKTEGCAHPETFIRARALDLFARGDPRTEAEIARMIEGPLALDELCLVGQRRLTAITRRVLERLLAPRFLRSDALLAHARHFFPDFAPPADDRGADDAPLADPRDLAHRSVQDYLAYVLLDFAVVDPALEDVPRAAALLVAEKLGIGERFRAVLTKELKLRKKAVEKLAKEAEAIVAAAGAEREA